MNKVYCILLMSSLLCLVLSANEKHHNFFSAAKEADSFLIVKISDGRQMSAKYMLPTNADMPSIEQMPELFTSPKAGMYICPVKSGEIMKFPFANIRVENPENIYSLLLRLRDMNPDAENAFLMSELSIFQPALRFAALRRLQENGVFESPFDQNTSARFKDFYVHTNLSVLEKRLLLENFSHRNFNQMLEVYILALSDRRVAKLSGKLFHENNRLLFSKIVREYISNEKLWVSGLWQSEYFMEDGDFVAQAMKHFNMENLHANSADFVPLLFSATNPPSDNDEIIKRLLTDSKNTKQHELYRNLAYWLNIRGTDTFKNEIMTFLVNNKGNHYITNSMIYPTMLSALRKSGHPQADRLLLDYLENLESNNNMQLKNQVCILFKEVNQPNPTLDSLINRLRQSF